MVVVAGVLVLVTAAAWLSLDSLTADENRLVGVWQCGAGVAGSGTWEFRPDRSSRLQFKPPPGLTGRGYDFGGRWAVHGDGILVDTRWGGLIRRQLQSVLGMFGVRTGAAIWMQVDFASDDEFVFIASDGTRQTWTRAPTD
jgi:hypothetical protein